MLLLFALFRMVSVSQSARHRKRLLNKAPEGGLFAGFSYWLDFLSIVCVCPLKSSTPFQKKTTDTFDDERYYQSITPTPALPVPATLQAVAPATAATTVITSDNTFQSEYIPVPRDERYEFPGMMPRDTRMYETGLVTATDNTISNPVPLYRDERHYYPVSTITSSYILDNRQYEQSINSPSMMHDRLYQPTTHTITSGMLYNDRHYETANSLGSLSNLASANECHGVEMMMRQDAAAVAAAAVIEHSAAAEVAWGRAEMERQDEIDRQYLVLLPREDKIEPQDELWAQIYGWKLLFRVATESREKLWLFLILNFVFATFSQ